MTVGAVMRQIARHPARFLATQWNWKAALLSALLRGAIFFSSTLSVGVAAAARALAVDAAFRVPMAGCCAALVQALRWAEPRLAATLIVVLGIPAMAHTIEIGVHSAAATPLLWRSVAASVALSIASSAVELILMRHDVLIVGPDARSLLADIRRAWQYARTGRA